MRKKHRHPHSPATQDIVYDENYAALARRIEKIKQEKGYPKICSLQDVFQLIQDAGAQISWASADCKTHLITTPKKIRITRVDPDDENSLDITYSND